jgi:hypothetical protein
MREIVGCRWIQQTQQHIGVPFIIMQQVQPGIIIAHIQSQQAWIIFMQLASPLVQVIAHPISIISTLHVPIMPMLQQHIGMPFIIMQQLIMPPCIIMHRFFIISAAVLSSQVQVTFMPPGHFSIFIVQRGIIMPMVFAIPGIMPLIMPGIIPCIIPPWASIPSSRPSFPSFRDRWSWSWQTPLKWHAGSLCRYAVG